MAIKYRRITTRTDTSFGEDFSDYPHWQKGYEFFANRGPSDETIVEIGNGRTHLRESCEVVSEKEISHD